VSPPSDGPGGDLPSERPFVPDRSASRQAVAYRLLGVGCALLGVLLVIGGLVALRGKPASTATGAAAISGGASSATATATSDPPASPTPAANPSPTSTAPARTTASPNSEPPTSRPPTSTPPSPPKAATDAGSPTPARAPLTVLNNTTRAHLAEQAAEEFRQGGWQVVQVGNFTGTIPMTTVYYTPGSATEERAAEALAAQFTGISRVLARYDGLPVSVHGLIVVLAPDWP
jgi:hypothetical protein